VLRTELPARMVSVCFVGGVKFYRRFCFLRVFDLSFAD